MNARWISRIALAVSTAALVSTGWIDVRAQQGGNSSQLASGTSSSITHSYSTNPLSYSSGLAGNIPEPGTIGLLLAGGAVVGARLLARRRAARR